MPFQPLEEALHNRDLFNNSHYKSYSLILGLADGFINFTARSGQGGRRT